MQLCKTVRTFGEWETVCKEVPDKPKDVCGLIDTVKCWWNCLACDSYTLETKDDKCICNCVTDLDHRKRIPQKMWRR